MRKYLLPAAAVAAAAVAPAQAATVPTIIFTANQFAVPGYITNAQNFVTGPGAAVGFEGGAVGSHPAGATGDAVIEQGSVPNDHLAPIPGSTNKYLAISAGGAYTISFAPAQVFSFVLGSIDSYNQVRLSFSDGSFQDLIGQGIIGATGLTGAPNYGLSGRVTYDMGGGASIVGAVFTSGQAAFEIDDLVTAAPEPATWGMMILGFGLAGAQLRSRRRSAKLAVA
jgi:hypothetical protein